MKQATLLDIAAAPKACPRCGLALRGRRCGPCQGGTPQPGGPLWHRWTRGLMLMIRDRLEAAGLRALVFPAIEAILADEGPVPTETAVLLADIAALPCSPRRYERALRRASRWDAVYLALRERGYDRDEAERIATQEADAYEASLASPRRVSTEPERLRVEVDRIRVATADELEIAAEDAAEDEAALAARVRP